MLRRRCTLLLVAPAFSATASASSSSSSSSSPSSSSPTSETAASNSSSDTSTTSSTKPRTKRAGPRPRDGSRLTDAFAGGTVMEMNTTKSYKQDEQFLIRAMKNSRYTNYMIFGSCFLFLAAMFAVNVFYWSHFRAFFKMRTAPGPEYGPGNDAELMRKLGDAYESGDQLAIEALMIGTNETPEDAAKRKRLAKFALQDPNNNSQPESMFTASETVGFRKPIKKGESAYKK